MSIRVTHPDGTVRDYPAGRSIGFDGFGDLVVYGEDQVIVATRARASVAETELLDDAPPSSPSPSTPR